MKSLGGRERQASAALPRGPVAFEPLGFGTTVGESWNITSMRSGVTNLVTRTSAFRFFSVVRVVTECVGVVLAQKGDPYRAGFIAIELQKASQPERIADV